MHINVFNATEPKSLIFRAITTREIAPNLIEEVITFNYKQVWVSVDGPSWKEFPLSRSTKLWSVLSQKVILDEVKSRAGGFITDHIAWMNVYARGEHIDWHRDRGGDMQLILVLEAPPVPEGQLMVRGKHEELVVPLDVGDAILFSASKIYHRTTPVITTGLQRVTAVMRFSL